jgi:hypothetical protein
VVIACVAGECGASNISVVTKPRPFRSNFKIGNSGKVLQTLFKLLNTKSLRKKDLKTSSKNQIKSNRILSISEEIMFQFPNSGGRGAFRDFKVQKNHPGPTAKQSGAAPAQSFPETFSGNKENRFQPQNSNKFQFKPGADPGSYGDAQSGIRDEPIPKSLDFPVSLDQYPQTQQSFSQHVPSHTQTQHSGTQHHEGQPKSSQRPSRPIAYKSVDTLDRVLVGSVCKAKEWMRSKLPFEATYVVYGKLYHCLPLSFLCFSQLTVFFLQLPLQED